MDLIEINQILGCISAELSLYDRDMGNVSVSILRKLASFLRDHQKDFEQEVANMTKNNATEFYLEEVYFSLTSYSDWYADNMDTEATTEVRELAKLIFEQIEILWRPVIERAFPKFMQSSPDVSDDDKDPLGYNKKYGRPGEKYRSIRYDLIANPTYPHLTPDVVYDRLKEIIARFSNDGADISRLLSIAFKHGLLKGRPYGKSVIRELGMTSTEQSLTQFIENPNEAITYSKRLEWMKEELLRE